MSAALPESRAVRGGRAGWVSKVTNDYKAPDWFPIMIWSRKNHLSSHAAPPEHTECKNGACVHLFAFFAPVFASVKVKASSEMLVGVADVVKLLSSSIYQ